MATVTIDAAQKREFLRQFEAFTRSRREAAGNPPGLELTGYPVEHGPDANGRYTYRLVEPDFLEWLKGTGLRHTADA